jgi:hypothetical protein
MAFSFSWWIGAGVGQRGALLPAAIYAFAGGWLRIVGSCETMRNHAVRNSPFRRAK